MKITEFNALGAPVRGYLWDKPRRDGSLRTRPAVIICAGGCYRWLSPREKDPVAMEFFTFGAQVFLLEYSTEELAKDYRPLRELAQTVVTIRERAEEFSVDPEKVLVLGFSAGGHLAASLGALWNTPEAKVSPKSRPDGLILCYPVISTREFAHEESAMWVSGGDEELRDRLCLQNRITSDFPKAFIWHGGEDASVPPENSLMLTCRLKEAGVSVEYHLFDRGAHGISVCTEEVETPEEACRPWVSLCKSWISRNFDFKM